MTREKHSKKKIKLTNILFFTNLIILFLLLGAVIGTWIKYSNY